MKLGFVDFGPHDFKDRPYKQILKHFFNIGKTKIVSISSFLFFTKFGRINQTNPKHANFGSHGISKTNTKRDHVNYIQIL